MAAEAGDDDGEAFVEFGGAVVGGQDGSEGAQARELGDGEAVQSEAEHVVDLVGVVDLLLQFVLDVAVEEPDEQAGGIGLRVVKA